MEDEALADIADRLYAAPLDGFVAARAAAVKEAAGQDKDLAAAVRGLPKPSVAAWALNMLARHRPDVPAQLGELGARMRAAQDALDAAALRELGRERRAMLADAVETARSVAREQGRSISDAMASDVEETLRALTADGGAANAVASGRLLKVLSADGVNDVDLDGAVALPGLLPAVPPGRPGGSPPAARRTTAQKAAADGTRTTTAPGSQPAPARPRLEAVRQTPRASSPPALERAKAVLAEALEAADDAGRLAGELREEEQQVRAEIAELQQETAELRNRLKAAEESLDRSRKRLSATAAGAKQAARAADKAARTAMLAQERVLRLGSS
ncbi:hypothetical protein NG819_00080 [Pseudarthrobacter sp. Fe7]|nr:hypothetical protein NG819_21400 [Pseudarthrobacter sp. Fe7]UUL76376.1 hypothetical protein NG819_00080 [Pseudarthrobacter sp. Fe7]